MTANEQEPKNSEPEQSAKQRIREAKEHILKSSTFINKTQPGKGMAIIGGIRNTSKEKHEKLE